MVRPWVGPPIDEHRGICLFALRPTDPLCGAPATRHVIVHALPYGVVGLTACDRDARIARAAGRFLAEHAFGLFCALPGSVWLAEQNRCVIDDRGVEPAPRGGPLAAAVPGGSDG